MAEYEGITAMCIVYSLSGGDTAFMLYNMLELYVPLSHLTLQWTRDLSGVRWSVKYKVELAPCIVPA